MLYLHEEHNDHWSKVHFETAAVLSLHVDIYHASVEPTIRLLPRDLKPYHSPAVDGSALKIILFIPQNIAVLLLY